MKRQLSLVLALVMILGSFTSVFAAMPTTEVDKAAFLAEEEVLLGNLEGDLKLADNLKRRDAVVLLSRLYGVEAEAKATNSDDLKFEDITDDFYKGFIAWSVNEGIVEGFSETEFAFNKEVKVQDYATMLLRVLKYDVNGDTYTKALADAEAKGILEGLQEVENMTTTTRGMAATMTFNALGVEVKGTGKTLAETLGIEMPEPDKPTDLKVEKVYTENLSEIRVKLSNAELVKTKDALYNPANYRLESVNDKVKVRHVHLEEDEVVLTLVPYGKVLEQDEFDVLTKGKTFKLVIRNIDPKMNSTSGSITATDNAIPVVEAVEFMGDYGIKVTTSEPIAKPEERNFRLNSRTSMLVEQYGRDIILTPYHNTSFDKDATELTVDLVDDFAGYRAAKTVEKMELTTDEGLPVVDRVYRSGSKLVVEFDRDVYHKSIAAYESRKNLGNVSFVERGTTFHAKDAVKVDTNVVEYTFEREVPKGIEVAIQDVANHFNKAMERDVRVADEYRDDFAPVIISSPSAVNATGDEKARVNKELVGLTKDEITKKYNKGILVETGKMAIVFDKDVKELADHEAWMKDNTKGKEITAKDVENFFTLYELDITNRGKIDAETVKINIEDAKSDRVWLTFEGIKLNNKDRDFDYTLEVRNFTDMGRNRMERDYRDFQVTLSGADFDVEVKGIKATDYFKRDVIEIVLEFTHPVNKDEAADARNYYLAKDYYEASHTVVDEAIVERDGRTVSLLVYGYDSAKKFLEKYPVLEISPRVTDLSVSARSVENRFWNLETGFAIVKDADYKVDVNGDVTTTKKEITFKTNLERTFNIISDLEKLTIDAPNAHVVIKGNVDEIEIIAIGSDSLEIAKGAKVGKIVVKTAEKFNIALEKGANVEIVSEVKEAKVNVNKEAIKLEEDKVVKVTVDEDGKPETGKTDEEKQEEEGKLEEVKEELEKLIEKVDPTKLGNTSVENALKVAHLNAEIEFGKKDATLAEVKLALKNLQDALKAYNDAKVGLAKDAFLADLKEEAEKIEAVKITINGEDIAIEVEYEDIGEVAGTAKDAINELLGLLDIATDDLSTIKINGKTFETKVELEDYLIEQIVDNGNREFAYEVEVEVEEVKFNLAGKISITLKKVVADAE